MTIESICYVSGESRVPEFGISLFTSNNPVGKYPVQDSTNFSEGTEKEVSKKEQFEEQTTKSQTTNSFL
ncbi:MAG: hypothetical protein WA631_05720 [Nitrososphaeraceae archaeon]